MWQGGSDMNDSLPDKHKKKTDLRQFRDSEIL